ncbi:MAG: MFS transporter [Gemmatimonadaceae bacterium]|nr:MFS transporter [Gemmatimonadaceae bacterium]NUQ93853.1 MFS transporter [Gemmatimonadaceae bacterium]NUR20531.1 MFS transporter [Gemmatimonadaceae bacterium]NUS96429.1 MFS transporter [Gemmatimonadaceae bacterium]
MTNAPSRVDEFLPSPARWWVLVTIGIGTFMSALDGSVVNTLLPVLSRELHTGIAAIEWVTTIYLLVISALLLSVGRAGDMFGHRHLYLAGFVIFVIGSALCGLSRSAHTLIALRALQATGAAMLYATAPAILTRTFPATQRGRALGAQGTFTYLGLTAGPSLGGWLAGAFGWRSVFYINVPVGIVAILLALRSIAPDHVRQQSERFDFGGAAAFTAGLVALLLALDQGHAWGWGSPRIVGLLVAAAGVLALFVRIEQRRESPMLDLTLFRRRVFSAATVSALLNYMCVYAVLFVLPFLLIQGRGLSVQRAGLVLTAQPIVMAVVAPVSGTLSDRIGSRGLATAGMLLLAAGLAWLALLARDGSLTSIAAALAVVGLGVGTFVSPNNSALMGAAPGYRQGIASGVLATARNVGMALGVGFAGAVFTTVVAHASLPADGLAAGVRASLFGAAIVATIGAVTSAAR